MKFIKVVSATSGGCEMWINVEEIAVVTNGAIRVVGEGCFIPTNETADEFLTRLREVAAGKEPVAYLQPNPKE